LATRLLRRDVFLKIHCILSVQRNRSFHKWWVALPLPKDGFFCVFRSLDEKKGRGIQRCLVRRTASDRVRWVGIQALFWPSLRGSGGVEALFWPSLRGSGGVEALFWPSLRGSGGVEALFWPLLRGSGGVEALFWPHSSPQLGFTKAQFIRRERGATSFILATLGCIFWRSGVS